MELRRLGATGIRVSAVGLGTVKLGRNEQVKYPSPFELPDDRQAGELLAAARELGINLLDTAPAYGTSEERVGRLLRDRRRDWVIVTKVGEEFENGRSRFDFSARATRASVERSLKRLRTDYLDVVLIHSHGGDEQILRREEALGVLSSLKEAGLVRSVGISSKTVAGGLLGVELTDVVMLAYNLRDETQAPVIAAARKAGKGVLIKKGLLSGHLDTAAPANLEAAMGFVFGQPGVSSIVVGTIDPVHLRADAAAAATVLNR